MVLPPSVVAFLLDGLDPGEAQACAQGIDPAPPPGPALDRVSEASMTVEVLENLGGGVVVPLPGVGVKVNSQVANYAGTTGGGGVFEVTKGEALSHRFNPACAPPLVELSKAGYAPSGGRLAYMGVDARADGGKGEEFWAGVFVMLKGNVPGYQIRPVPPFTRGNIEDQPWGWGINFLPPKSRLLELTPGSRGL